jgi:hypothetical protein
MEAYTQEFRRKVKETINSEAFKGTVAQWQKQKQRKAFQSKYQLSEN